MSKYDWRNDFESLNFKKEEHCKTCKYTLYKKMKLSTKDVSSKSAVSGEFNHIYWRNP